MFLYSRHQVQHYTNQVAKETNNYIKDLTRHTQNANQSEQVGRLVKLLDSFLINNLRHSRFRYLSKSSTVSFSQGSDFLLPMFHHNYSSASQNKCLKLILHYAVDFRGISCELVTLPVTSMAVPTKEGVNIQPR